MVDLNATPHAKEPSKIESFPGIGILKSKFLTVLGNSNDLLTGISNISNKFTLSNNSSDTDYDDEEIIPHFDESIDYTKIDFESRRVKARRAHEEVVSGRYRLPNWAPIPRIEAHPTSETASPNGLSYSSSSSTSSLHTNVGDRSQVSSTTYSNSIESRNSGGYRKPGHAIPGARRSDIDMQKDQRNFQDVLNVAGQHLDLQPKVETLSIAHAAASSKVRSRISNSSTLTSLHDEHDTQLSPSMESSELRNFIRSESQNSVPSWASSISLDCQVGDDVVKGFMKKFIDILFNNSSAISLESKSEFGALARLETGRQWFTRFVLQQKQKSKRVTELTFHSLVQFFAIVLFECVEFEDFAPSATIMNLSFLFYHEIEVPGCVPYREYLFTYMRQQPIWRTLRFWNAALFDAVQSERENCLIMATKRAEKNRKKQLEMTPITVTIADDAANDAVADSDDKNNELSGDSSSSSSYHNEAGRANSEMKKYASLNFEADEKKLNNEIQIIAFRQLGTFTCNMHSLGIPQELCLEFLKKQSSNFNLPKDKTKFIQNNINRMYHETDAWGAKEP